MSEFGELIPQHTHESATQTSEVITEIPGKRIGVIGVEHGAGDTYFPSQELAEELLGKYFPSNPTAMVIDSFPLGIDYFGNNAHFDKEALQQKVGDHPNFWQWSALLAANKGISIIGADFHAIGSNTEPLLVGEAQVAEKKKFDLYKEEVEQVYNQDRTAFEENADLKFKTLGADALSLGYLLALGLRQLKDDKPLPRRAFLKGALAAGTLLAGPNIFSTLQEINLTNLRDQRLTAASLNHYDSMTDENAVWNSANDAEFSDPDKILHNQTNDQLPEYKRMEQIDVATDADSAVLLFRNAIIAEILTTPNAVLFPHLPSDQKEQIACIMGLAHLVLPEKYTINGFLKDDVLRRRVINDGVKLIIGALDKDKSLKITRSEIKERLRHLGNIFSISPEGQVETTHFTVPYLNEVANKY